MNEYMLNALEIKQILGLNILEDEKKGVIQVGALKDGASRIRHRSVLSVMHEFVEKNSQF